MPIRYEMATLTVPASGSDRQRILTVPDGKKDTLRALSVHSTSGYKETLYLQDSKVVETETGISMYYGSFIPLDDLIDKPTDIDIELTDIGGGAATIYITLMYEE